MAAICSLTIDDCRLQLKSSPGFHFAVVLPCRAIGDLQSSIDN